MSEEQKRILQEKLWGIANILRGKMTADDYKDYILGFIFYKYLSEKIELFINTELLSEDDFAFADINESMEDYEELLKDLQKDTVEELGYFLKPNELFSYIAKKGNNESEGESNFILDDLETILKNIESSTMGTESQEDYENLFEDLDLTSSKLGKSEKAKNEIIAKVLAKLDEIDFKLHDTNADILGDAYEYMIGNFASDAGKKAGEFYTPQEVSTLLAQIVTSKRKPTTIYDPTCGSGSLLLRVAKALPKDEHPKFYGQELTRTTYNLARMNMILHGVHYRDFDIKNEDTLEHPQHRGMEFDAIVANPPFSAHWSARELFLSDDRFSQYGKLAPKTKADFAFVQHMISHLAENGTMAVVLPHGVLFRGAAERHIRKYMIEDRNYIDAVIGLPSNIFFGTPISTCILVLKKCRENPSDILFIDASGEDNFEKVKTQNKLRLQDIQKIVNTYKAREQKIDKYSYRATLDEIRENDYNLNISRYVDTFEEEEDINLESVVNILGQNNELSKKNDETLKKYCDDLQLPFPIGNNILLLKEYKKGVIQKIFNQDIRFKKDDGSEFEKWQYKNGDKIFKPVTNKNHNSDLPILAISQEFGAVPREMINYKISVTEKSVSTYKVVEEGDFIISLRSFQGGIEYSNYKGICSPAYIILRPFIEVDSHFYKFYFKTDRYIKLLNRHIEGIRDGKMISYRQFSDIKLPYPSPKEQTKIANFLSSIEFKIEKVQNQLREIKNS